MYIFVIVLNVADCTRGFLISQQTGVHVNRLVLQLFSSDTVEQYHGLKLELYRKIIIIDDTRCPQKNRN